MAVLSINSGEVTFPHSDMQARYFLATHLNNKMPSDRQMKDWLNKDISWRQGLGVAGKRRHKLIAGRMFHWINYMDQLAELGSLQPLPRVLDGMFLYTALLIVFKGLPQARKTKFNITDEGSFKTEPSYLSLDLLYHLVPSL